jgi:putative restriction endonuclease
VAAGRTYGHIPGYPEKSEFTDRAELARTGVHRPLQGGISGGQDGADSIVVSGGYPDDEDYGAEIIYTGQGGRDRDTRRQVENQELTRGNVGLVRSRFDGRPVRVIRGAGGNSVHSPARGLRYDGLWQVVDHWHDKGRDGFRIWRFRLVKLSDEASGDSSPTTDGPAPRTTRTGTYLIRNPLVPARVKKLHDFTCQLCGTRLETAAGPYAEGAHIRGLGRPHNGPDNESNMLCLCPNDHFLFDAGAIYVDAKGSVWDAVQRKVINSLRQVGGHHVNPEHLRYHREHHATP